MDLSIPQQYLFKVKQLLILVLLQKLLHSTTLYCPPLSIVKSHGFYPFAC
jgi:hypothetical protein